MPKTPGGLPYPEGSDPVAGGASNIQALAEAIDTRGGGHRVETRHVIVQSDGNGTAVIPFLTAFPGPPNVTLTAGVNGLPTVWCAIYQPQLMASQFTLFMNSGSGTAWVGGLDIVYTATGAVAVSDPAPAGVRGADAEDWPYGSGTDDDPYRVPDGWTLEDTDPVEVTE